LLQDVVERDLIFGGQAKRLFPAKEFRVALKTGLDFLRDPALLMPDADRSERRSKQRGLKNELIRRRPRVSDSPVTS
jgi:hypothetical protein